MPIFEYACRECGTKFEKLIRRDSDYETLACPNCGTRELQKEHSTFAPQMGASKGASMPAMCPSGGMCPTPGKCGLN